MVRPALERRHRHQVTSSTESCGLKVGRQSAAAAAAAAAIDAAATASVGAAVGDDADVRSINSSLQQLYYPA